jgi:hypothetical protein
MEATAKAAAESVTEAATESTAEGTTARTCAAESPSAESVVKITFAETESAESVVETEPAVQAVVTEGTRLLLAIGPTRIAGILPAVVVPLPSIAGIAVDVAVRSSIEIVADTGGVEGPCLASARVADGGLVRCGSAAKRAAGALGRAR